MIDYVFAPGVQTAPQRLHPELADWLSHWLDRVAEDVEKREIAASTCVAGLIAENWLHGHRRTDWLGAMKELLEFEGMPIAYSEEYGRRLYQFNQWRQTTVHAVHSRWWIERSLGEEYEPAGELIETFVQPSGFVYNPQVSETGVRTRMRSELLMSLAMGSEILVHSGRRKALAALTSAAVKLPATPYIGAEYFRLRALETLGNPKLMVGNVLETVRRCRAPPGFADFCVEDKVDDYMGTAKRVGRDHSAFSPISSLQALFLARSVTGEDQHELLAWSKEISTHLSRDPLGIPSLKMRDLEAPFGEGATVYEVLSAAHLLT